MFDVIITVDWSASARPTRGVDSIWSFELHRGSASDPTRAMNHPTRAAACNHLMDRLVSLAGNSVLVGFDFPLGYPIGFARASGLASGAEPNWAAVWRHLGAAIIDDERNRNNRWEVAADLNRRLGRQQFWGVPRGRQGPDLPMHRPPVPAADRFVEQRLSALGLRPFSPWQLLGAGSVGSQSLTGIPAVDSLRRLSLVADRTRVWPFETGFTPTPTAGLTGAIVLVEVWPSAIAFSHVDHPVKDARQVVALAEWLADASRSDRLGAMFCPALPDRVAAAAVTDEGWVLGVE